jgi:hypothetical protein
MVICMSPVGFAGSNGSCDNLVGFNQKEDKGSAEDEYSNQASVSTKP